VGTLEKADAEIISWGGKLWRGKSRTRFASSGLRGTGHARDEKKGFADAVKGAACQKGLGRKRKCGCLKKGHKPPVSND